MTEYTLDCHTRTSLDTSAAGSKCRDRLAQVLPRECVTSPNGVSVLAACCANLHFIASTEEWDRVVSINLKGVMLCYRYAAIQMVKQGRGGRIIGQTLQCCLLVLRAYS